VATGPKAKEVKDSYHATNKAVKAAGSATAGYTSVQGKSNRISIAHKTSKTTAVSATRKPNDTTSNSSVLQNSSKVGATGQRNSKGLHKTKMKKPVISGT